MQPCILRDSVSFRNMLPARKSFNRFGITWDETTLGKWLSDPDMLVPDNKMDFHVPSAQERSDLIAYFKRQKGQN
jgi:cytochrome c2